VVGPTFAMWVQIMKHKINVIAGRIKTIDVYAVCVLDDFCHG
jgi:hypothetical protein